jgi:murein DD-endopeptidase MepM/ murein hydrolase activator NlpD
VSPSALEALQRPIGDPITGGTFAPDELDVVREDVDVDQILFDIVKLKKRFDIDVRASVTSADIELSIDGAHQLIIVVHDPRRTLYRSGSLDYAIDVNIHGWWWRLVKRAKSGDDLTLTFEPRAVAWLRAHNGHKKARRGKITRAEFIRGLVLSIKKGNVKFRAPELHKSQSVGRSPTLDETTRRQNRSPGFPNSYTIPHGDSSQTKIAEEILALGDQKGARRKLQVVTMMAVYQESAFRKSATNGVHVGLWQQDPQYWPAKRDVKTDGTAWYNALLKADKKSPNQRYVDLIESVQASGQPDAYAKWRDDAEEIVTKYYGTAGSGSISVTRIKPYEFRVKKNENWYGTAMRLADEVQWRLWTIKDVFHYQSENDLFKSKPLMKITEGKDGIDWIDPDEDSRRKTSSVNVTCRMKTWLAPIGTVIQVDEDGGWADGNYLVAGLKRSLFSQSGTVTLRKPVSALQEPPNDTTTSTTAAGGSGAFQVGDLVYPLPTKGKDLGGVAAHKARAWGNWQSDNAVDIGTPMGTPVFAVEDGTITKLGGSWNGGQGNPDGYNITLDAGRRSWFYTHLKSRRPLRVGQHVQAGELFGSSGAANGVQHLHIAVSTGDPEKILGVK